MEENNLLYKPTLDQVETALYDFELAVQEEVKSVNRGRGHKTATKRYERAKQRITRMIEDLCSADPFDYHKRY